MLKRTLLLLSLAALLCSTTACIFRNHGHCDSEDTRRYGDDCRR